MKTKHISGFTGEINDEDVLAILEQNLQVRWTGYGTWTVSSQIEIEVSDDTDAFADVDSFVLKAHYITHDENCKYGIFDGERYNPLCGFADKETLEAWVRDEWDGKTVEEVQAIVWSDHTDEDNYEPANERDRRLAEGLLDSINEQIENI